MRLFATKSPTGAYWTTGGTPLIAVCRWEEIRRLRGWDDNWSSAQKSGWTVVPVSLTELPAESEESKGA